MNAQVESVSDRMEQSIFGLVTIPSFLIQEQLEATGRFVEYMYRKYVV